jgi:hypothetical protein
MKNVTGRDGMIIRQALAYAIATIARLPRRQQEASNAQDMCALLTHLCPDDADFYIADALAHIQGHGLEGLPDDDDGGGPIIGRPLTKPPF